MKITKPLLKSLRPEIEAALVSIGDKHGINLKLGNASYDANTFTFKLEGAVRVTEDGGTVAQAEWDTYRDLYDLGHVNFGDTVMFNGKAFTIAGVKPKSSKYPILLADPRGDVIKVMARSVISGHRAAA